MIEFLVLGRNLSRIMVGLVGPQPVISRMLLNNNCLFYNL